MSPCLSDKVGYCIGNDQYFKRDDVGIIYQMNVMPGKQRGFVGATLLKAMFERSAYGCRLYCCWCAQDIEANYFWESMGFVPLAFRAGSAKKSRVHIFWQRRIREGDTTTPYWFPSQTNSGSIREDRLVFPIPPGMHWKDEMPRVLPEERHEGTKALRHEGKERRSRSASVPSCLRASVPSHTLGRLQFAPPVEPKKKRSGETPKPRVKNDPALVAKARELKDRWLERVNADPSLLAAQEKYDVSRAIEHRDSNAQDRSAIVDSRPSTLALPQSIAA